VATVHQTEITLEEFQDLLVDLEIRETCDLGGALSITGRHPDLGPVVAVQDGANVFLLTQRPLSFSGIADTYLLETAIARMVQQRKALQECQSLAEQAPKLPIHPPPDSPPEKEVSQPLRGMLTWLGIDPLTATAREIDYAREAVAHVHKMAALPPDKLAELHTALVDDIIKLAA
jgi:hypothetical protein